MLFSTDTFLSNYADDNNLYNIGKDRDIIKKCSKDFRALTEWLFFNYTVSNQKIVITCTLVETSKNDKFAFYFLFLENAKEGIVLGVAIDTKLNFDSLIKNICRKGGKELGALLRITHYLNSSKKTTYIKWNDKISTQSLPFNLDVLLKQRK